jgi:hypothetical protein
MSINQLDIAAGVSYPEGAFATFVKPPAEVVSLPSMIIVPHKRKRASLTNYFADVVAGVPGQPALDSELTQAATYGDCFRVEALIKAGADPKAGNSRALRISAANGHCDVVRLLLENRADVHANNDQALCDAACGGYFDVVETLLKYGANPEVDGGAALVLAKKRQRQISGAFHVRRTTPRNGHSEIIKLLKRVSADLCL